MGAVADLEFGTEQITVDKTTVVMDVCKLAECIYDALAAVPEDTVPLKEISVTAPLVNKVLTDHGLPTIPVDAAAYKFAQDIVGRALAIKKEARGAWASSDEPALPPDTQD